HCDFAEQVTVSHDGKPLRPDLVVRLPGGRAVVVDSKVPLDAFLDASGTSDPDEHEHHLARHARQVRSHIDALSSKSYWRALKETPEFVVLFLPAESFLSAALQSDAGLLEHAARKQIVIASPTNLIGLLRTVAHGWNQQTLAEQTREIHELGRTLHERIGKVATHLDKLGRSLSGSVEAYNSAIGSLESRVLVTARQFSDLAVTDEHLAAPRPVEVPPRPLTAPELLEALTPHREELGGSHGVASARETG
ncbi:MAG: DNA recombination protein RmuC, partial [Myxococcales bacterium]